MSPKISIVIPVYNTGPYLRRCLDSVCGQTLRDIEIICVNDASPDNALVILREYAAQDSRITIIDFSRNLGRAATRNAAMAIARGEYLGFVDSDDAIDLYFYEKLYAKASATGAFITKGVLQRVFEDGTRVVMPVNDQVRLNKLNFTWNWTTAIYQTHFIRSNGINCPVEANYSQDVAFLYKSLAIAPGVETVDDTWYYYFKRTGSASSCSFDAEATRSFLKAPEDIVAFLHSRKIDEEAYSHLFAKAITYCLTGRPFTTALPDALDEISQLCAEMAIRLYATCLRPDAVGAKLAASMPSMNTFLQAADHDGLAHCLCQPRAQKVSRAQIVMDLRVKLRRHQA